MTSSTSNYYYLNCEMIACLSMLFSALHLFSQTNIIFVVKHLLLLFTWLIYVASIRIAKSITEYIIEYIHIYTYIYIPRTNQCETKKHVIQKKKRIRIKTKDCKLKWNLKQTTKNQNIATNESEMGISNEQTSQT